jgi:peptidylprolyl isomerase
MPGFMIQGGDISLSRAATATDGHHPPILPFDDIPKGGTSIYHPSALNQEIRTPALRHTSRGMLSMASRPVKDRTAPGMQNAAGPTVNGSQFFITFVPAPHLDGESTLFGRVLNLTAQDENGDVLGRLENSKAKVDKKGRVIQPKEGEEIEGEWEALKLVSVTIHANPFAK